MVVGNGLIAKKFIDYIDNDSFLIFASGVSNSKNANADEYQKEFSLLEKNIEKNAEKTFVYFSTCSIEDPSLKNSPYVIHKKNIEKHITNTCKKFIIFRLSNVVGQTKNPHTIFNYFIEKIKNKQAFEVWENANRNLIDVDDVFIICNFILNEKEFQNQIINIANPISTSVLTIVKIIELHFGNKGIYTKTPKGKPFNIDLEKIKKVLLNTTINFQENYISLLLKKYFPNDL